MVLINVLWLQKIVRYAVLACERKSKSNITEFVALAENVLLNLFWDLVYVRIVSLVRF